MQMNCTRRIVGQFLKGNLKYTVSLESDFFVQIDRTLVGHEAKRATSDYSDCILGFTLPRCIRGQQPCQQHNKHTMCFEETERCPHFNVDIQTDEHTNKHFVRISSNTDGYELFSVVFSVSYDKESLYSRLFGY